MGGHERFAGPGGAPLDGLAVAGDPAPGDQGGPVVDARGVVAGVVTHVERGTGWYVAPVEVVRKVVDDLLTTGEVRHARLGVEVADAAPVATGGPTAHGDEIGAAVAAVVPDGPADHGGCRSATSSSSSTASPSPAPTCWSGCGPARRATRSTSGCGGRTAAG